MSFKLRFFVFILIISQNILPQPLFQIVEKADYIILQLNSVSKIQFKQPETVPGGVSYTVIGENLSIENKFIQHSFNYSYIDYYIQQQLKDNEIQFILNEGKEKFRIFAVQYADSLFNCHIYIFNKNKMAGNQLAIYLQGVEEQQKREWDKALESYRKSIRLFPENGNAYFKAGQVRMQKKEYSKAVVNFKKAISFNSDSVNVYKQLAQVYELLRDKEKSKIYWDKYNEKINRIHLVRENKNLLVQTERKSGIQDEYDVVDKETAVTTSRLYYIAIPVMMIMLIIVYVFLRRKEEIIFDEDEIFQGETEISKVSEETVTEHEHADYTGNEEEELFPRMDKPASQKKNEEIEPERIISTSDPLEAEKIMKTREQELGVGEHDLALNIKAKMKGKKRLSGKEDLIIEMYNHGIKIEDIARELNLNFGEVDLVIGLNKHRLLKYRR